MGQPEVGVVARPEPGRRDDWMVDSFITISQTTLEEHFIVEDHVLTMAIAYSIKSQDTQNPIDSLSGIHSFYIF